MVYITMCYHKVTNCRSANHPFTRKVTLLELPFKVQRVLRFVLSKENVNYVIIM